MGKKKPERLGTMSILDQSLDQHLLEKWTKRKWDGPLQYEDESGELMMLPSDLALLEPPWRQYVEQFANDEDDFFKEFSKAYEKLMNLGFNSL